MPAIMDDPSSPTIYRVAGEAPYPAPGSPLPASVLPRQVTLRDRQTVATVVPFASREQVPPSLLLYLSDQFAKEVEKGDTYPMIDPMPFERFAAYWFQNFGAIMLLGSIEKAEDVVEGKDWARECLGSFYIKPNYPGRSSHVCNAGFLVTDASRNRGVGRLMGESYLDWAPRLGYKYSVFNLVYETNVASCRIWDALGFKRIGRVPGCGDLKSYPGRLVDAIIYGRDLSVGEENEELVSEERFEKIKFYLKHAKYPDGADRAEKSRLRSAATHYKLLEGDVLMLKDKEVISDPARQYDIARRVHAQQHAGINKTTATIAERYHWRGIKDTVSDVIRGCAECEDGAKASSSLVKPPTPSQTATATTTIPQSIPPPTTAAPVSPSHPVAPTAAAAAAASAYQGRHLSSPPAAASCAPQQMQHHHSPAPYHAHPEAPDVHSVALSAEPPLSPIAAAAALAPGSYAYPPIDPQIMNQQHHPYAYEPTPVSHIDQDPAQAQQQQQQQHALHAPYQGAQPELDIEVDALQQLIRATSHDQLDGVGDASDRDLDMTLAP